MCSVLVVRGLDCAAVGLEQGVEINRGLRVWAMEPAFKLFEKHRGILVLTDFCQCRGGRFVVEIKALAPETQE